MMKYRITDIFPNDFFKGKKGPLVSMYVDTARQSPQNKQDSLVFKNLVKDVEKSLLKKYEPNVIAPLMALFDDIVKDRMFWSYTSNGMALYASLDECIIYKLDSSPKTFAVVANSFHIKPLIQYMQLAQNYQIISIDAKGFQVYEGNKYGIEKLELGSFSFGTLLNLLGQEYPELEVTKIASDKSGGSFKQNSYYGYVEKEQEDKQILERFFKSVDEIVLDNFSKESRLPLILVAPIEYHSLFYKVSKNKFLEPKAIAGKIETIDKAKLLNELRAYAKDTFDAKIAILIEKYNNLRIRGQSTDQIIDIIHGMIDGKIETLFIEEDRIIPAKIDYINKQIIRNELNNPEFDDILDDLGQLGLEKNTEIIILKQDSMPTNTGVAAIFRY